MTDRRSSRVLPTRRQWARNFCLSCWCSPAAGCLRGGLFLSLIVAAQTTSADILIDDFERPNAPAPWTFSNGPEFPGATGSLSVGTGYSGQGAHLAYNLSQGGHYVSANRTLPTPLSVTAIAFWVKSPPNITIVLRVVDSSGQTLQYNLRRPLENLDPSLWYQHMVPLDGANGWWGGANDGQVHSPITGLSILAADPPIAGAIGAIDFDDVTALSTTQFDLDPARQPLSPAPTGSGDVLARLGANIHFTSDNRALDAARNAGLSWVRMDLIWSAVETTPNLYNWTAYDNLISSLRSRGMKALLILDYGNALYTGANNLPPTNSGAIRAFGNFSYAAARHFAGSGARFEIWNEPNYSGFWPPTANSTQYAALAQTAISRIREGDSNAVVVTGGVSGFDYNFVAGYLAQGGGTGANAIGVHPYDCNPPERLSDKLLLFRSLVASNYANPPPVWDTEWGFSSSSFGDGHSGTARQRQAVLVSREFLSAAAAGFPLIIYYDIRDDGTNPTNVENNFGLLANDYTDKPAMTALETLATNLCDRRLSGFIHALPSSLTALRIDGRTNLIVALWTAAGYVTVTVPTNASGTDFLGAPLPLLNWTNRLAWTLYETNGPVYLSFPYTWQATNLAPVFPPITNLLTVIAGATFCLTNTASYHDAPVQTLTYSLLVGPAGATINSTNAVLTWRPRMAQIGTSNLFTIVATDDGVPSLTATQSFTVMVGPPAAPTFVDPQLIAGAFRAQIRGDPGPDYSIQTSTDLLNWSVYSNLISPSLPISFVAPGDPSGSTRLYRVQLGP